MTKSLPKIAATPDDTAGRKAARRLSLAGALVGTGGAAVNLSRLATGKPTSRVAQGLQAAGMASQAPVLAYRVKDEFATKSAMDKEALRQLTFTKGLGLPGNQIFRQLKDKPRFLKATPPSSFWFYPLQGTNYYMGIHRSYQKKLEKAKGNKQRLLLASLMKAEVYAAIQKRPSPGLLIVVFKDGNKFHRVQPQMTMGMEQVKAAAADEVPAWKRIAGRAGQGAGIGMGLGSLAGAAHLAQGHPLGAVPALTAWGTLAGGALGGAIGTAEHAAKWRRAEKLKAQADHEEALRSDPEYRQFFEEHGLKAAAGPLPHEDEGDYADRMLHEAGLRISPRHASPAQRRLLDTAPKMTRGEKLRQFFTGKTPQAYKDRYAAHYKAADDPNATLLPKVKGLKSPRNNGPRLTKGTKGQVPVNPFSGNWVKAPNPSTTPKLANTVGNLEAAKKLLDEHGAPIAHSALALGGLLGAAHIAKKTVNAVRRPYEEPVSSTRAQSAAIHGARGLQSALGAQPAQLRAFVR